MPTLISHNIDKTLWHKAISFYCFDMLKTPLWKRSIQERWNEVCVTIQSHKHSMEFLSICVENGDIIAHWTILLTRTRVDKKLLSPSGEGISNFLCKPRCLSMLCCSRLQRPSVYVGIDSYRLVRRAWGLCLWWPTPALLSIQEQVIILSFL